MRWIFRLFSSSDNDASAGDHDEFRYPKAIHERTGSGITGDNPIRYSKEDALNRSGVARSFACQVFALDARQGAVVGVLGAWGSGKTSFINLAREEFDQVNAAVLDFNPWMFSGAEQLVESFFVELSVQLKLRPGLGEVGKNLEDYGEAFAGMAWLPLVGPWIERGRGATNILSKILQRRKEGIGGRREKLEKALAALRKPILVVLDDIDRLSTSEIRDVFKLVRLTASFPNVIYILAFDRTRVEEALAEQGAPGRDYLEKILQVAVDLPAIPSHVLDRQIFSAIEHALSEIESTGPFDETVWPDIFSEIIRPLIRNMRDVRRYAAAIHGTVRSIDGQIALTDLLALEAIRVFLPDSFTKMQNAIHGLTTTSGITYGGRDESPHIKSQIDDLIQAAGNHERVIRGMINRLFPAGERHIGGSHYGPDWKNRWLRERRVAHEDILRLYFERVAGEGLQAFTDAEQAWSRMADREALDGYLRSIDSERLQDVIASLEAYEDHYASEHVIPGAIVLLNIMPDLPDRPRGIFGLDRRLVVTRVTYRLLRSLGDADAVKAAVDRILPELKTLSSKLEVINMVGYREGVGHKLVSEDVASELEKNWREEVRSMSVDDIDLDREHDLLRVFLLTKRESDSSEGSLDIPDEPRMTLALLRTARSDVISQTMESRAIRRSPRLAWNVLVELFGDQATLQDRIGKLKGAEPEDVGDLLELVNKYLDGWRPSDFGDE